MILAFMLPLMPARDFEHAISWQCHYAIMRGDQRGLSVLKQAEGAFTTKAEAMLKAVAAQAAIATAHTAYGAMSW